MWTGQIPAGSEGLVGVRALELAHERNFVASHRETALNSRQ